MYMLPRQRLQFQRRSSSIAMRFVTAAWYLILGEVPVKLVHFVEGHCIKELFVEWNREVVPADIQ